MKFIDNMVEGIIVATEQTIKGSSNIKTTTSGDTTVISQDKPLDTNYKPSNETKSGLVDLIIDDEYKQGTYTEDDKTHNNQAKAKQFAAQGAKYAWSRSFGGKATKGVKLKVITRTYFDKEYDKNFNFYFILTISKTGQIVKIEGEFREDAFETTLHEHPMPSQGNNNVSQ